MNWNTTIGHYCFSAVGITAVVLIEPNILMLIKDLKHFSNDDVDYVYIQ